MGSFNYSRDFCRKRIVGGQNAPKGAYPWHVLITKSGDITCGGSLLNDRWVLTGTCHPLLTLPNCGSTHFSKEAVVEAFRFSHLQSSSVT